MGWGSLEEAAQVSRHREGVETFRRVKGKSDESAIPLPGVNPKEGKVGVQTSAVHNG